MIHLHWKELSGGIVAGGGLVFLWMQRTVSRLKRIILDIKTMPSGRN
jgi:hypothetical protein